MKKRVLSNLQSPRRPGTECRDASLSRSLRKREDLLSLRLLDRLCPWKKLTITAEFNGILPKEARKKALVARDHFDNLYLIVDQQHRWKSALLPDPTPRALDPLLIGELKQGDQRKYFVIDQFDLTEAEQYLVEEFAAKPDDWRSER